MAQQPLRVAIADDHPLMREALTSLLTKNPQIDLAGTATSFADALHVLATRTVDVLVLDLLGMDGSLLALVNRMQREYPKTAIVVFSSSVNFAPEVLKAGVLGYVAKEELSSQLLTAIEFVRHGRRFLSPIAEEYVTRAESQGVRLHLTPQQRTVLKLLTRGLSTEEIALELAVGESSAQNYITTLRRITGCNSRVQLVEWYKRMYGDDE